MKRDDRGYGVYKHERQRRKLFGIRAIVCLVMLPAAYFFFNSGLVYEYSDMISKAVAWVLEMNKGQPQASNIPASGIEEVQEEVVDTARMNEEMVLLKEENESLQRYNQELLSDNLHLQNSLKLAAEAGIKPQNYTRPPVVTSRSGFDRWEYLGKFEGTAYTPSREECGNNKGITYSGEPVVPGVSIAVDIRYWPIGTVFYIKGLGYVTAMDTGSKVGGKNRFDFAVFDKRFAFALGRQEWDVYLVRRGEGVVPKLNTLE